MKNRIFLTTVMVFSTLFCSSSRIVAESPSRDSRALNITLLTSANSSAFAQKPKDSNRFRSCLPAGIAASDVVEYRSNCKKNVTVASKLTKLNAQCKGTQLFDRNKKEIRFFKKTCWGHPPPNYQELKTEERRNLELLQSRYVVIVIECDPRIP
jgi:hypothetical protein